MEYPRPRWTQTFVSTMDLSGNPATVVGPDDKLYFAVASKGLFTGTLTSRYTIFVGCLSSSGTTEWVFQTPLLTSNAEDVQPTLALGPTGELYLAFTTTGNIPGYYNAADILSLCGSCGSTAGRQDLVIARINGATVGSPSVAWRIQNGYINSCNNEYLPTLLVANNCLFLVYQCNSATLCSPPIGTSNIICVSFDLNGNYLWSYQGNLVNGPGANESPSIAVDLSGNIYIAYTITAAVSGGTLQGTQDIEVVRLRQTGSSFTRDWILSNVSLINSTGVNADPHIVFDVITNRLYLAFTATQTIPGGTKTATGSDLVVACLSLTGAIVFIRQMEAFNGAAYRYSSIDHPHISLNQYGVMYISAHAVLESTGSEMILAFQINPGTMKGWFFRQGANEFNAYLAAADIVAPFQVLLVSAPFSKPILSIFAGQVYMTFIRFNSATLYVVAMAQNINYLEYTAQQYMQNIVPLC